MSYVLRLYPFQPLQHYYKRIAYFFINSTRTNQLLHTVLQKIHYGLDDFNTLTELALSLSTKTNFSFYLNNTTNDFISYVVLSRTTNNMNKKVYNIFHESCWKLFVESVCISLKITTIILEWFVSYFPNESNESISIF